MRDGKKKRWHVSAAMILAIVSTVICVSFLINTAKLKKELYEETKDYMMDSNAQAGENIAYQMKTDLQLVEGLAESIGNIPRFSVIEAVLKQKKEQFAMEEILIVRPEQIVFPQVYHQDILAEWNTQNPAVWEKSAISSTENNQIIFSSPILHKEKKTGYVLLGVKSYAAIQDILRKTNDKYHSINALISANGKWIAGPIGKDTRGLIQNQELKEKLYSALFSRLDENGMQNMLDFTMELTSGEKLLVSAYPLQINDWIQVSVVPWSLQEKEYAYHLVIYFWLVMAVGMAAGGGLWYIIALQREARERLEKIAYYDAMTGGMTNEAFQMQCLNCLRKANWSCYAVVYWNLCDFKYINENWSIDSGNQTLRYIYQVFQKNIAHDELAARCEVDHFFLLLHGTTETEVIQRTENLVQQINAFASAGRQRYHLDFIIGACMAEPHSGGIQLLHDRARRAAQFAEGVNRCTFYNESVIAKINWENRLNTLFEESLQNHDFEVYLQPKVYLQQNRPCAAEALVRWFHPEEGVIYPSDFIPIFEENGKICQLDLYIFEEVCKLIAGWRIENKPFSEISVNVSRAHLKDTAGTFPKIYCALKEKYQIPDGVIQLELTETSILGAHQTSYVTEVICELHRAGFSCALDDFGIGYSSLSMLKDFDVDTIKLDRSFFINESERSRILVANLIRLAHDMQIQIVAEGIETKEQVEVLRSFGCDLIQGYFYAKPLAIPAFEDWQEQEILRWGKYDEVK